MIGQKISSIKYWSLFQATVILTMDNGDKYDILSPSGETYSLTIRRHQPHKHQADDDQFIIDIIKEAGDQLPDLSQKTIVQWDIKQTMISDHQPPSSSHTGHSSLVFIKFDDGSNLGFAFFCNCGWFMDIKFFEAKND